MKIDVEDILCKAEAISLQMVKCKVYRVSDNCKIFFLFARIQKDFLSSKMNASFSKLRADTKH
jgi:hypothetical protein